jgi:hypothetical protein
MEKQLEKQYVISERLRHDVLALIASIKFSQYEHGAISQVEQALLHLNPYEETASVPE